MENETHINKNEINISKSQTYAVVCALISAAISGGAFKVPLPKSEGSSKEDENSPIGWEAVFEFMKLHRVAGLAAPFLSDLPITGELRSKWKRYIYEQRIFYDQLLGIEGAVGDILSDLPAAVIKGTAAAIYYPDPMQRTMGDIDILVARGGSKAPVPDAPVNDKESTKNSENCEPSDKINNAHKDMTTGRASDTDSYHTRARARLLQQYELDDYSEDRHTHFHSGRVQIELHRRMATILSADKLEYFDSMLDGAVHRAEKRYIGDTAFMMLPKTENGLVILMHIYHHLQSGVGLRQVTDWLAFLTDKEPVDWQLFNEVTRHVGIYKFECVLTRMCEIYFDMKLPLEACGGSDAKDTDALSHRLMEYVLSSGNFGSTAKTKYGSRFSLTGIKGNVFKRLQMGGMCRWKAARKYPILRPFAWAYQALRIAKEILTLDDPAGTFRSSMDEAAEIKALINDLGLELVSMKGK